MTFTPKAPFLGTVACDLAVKGWNMPWGIFSFLVGVEVFDYMFNGEPHVCCDVEVCL
jgi:hypothetical protein